MRGIRGEPSLMARPFIVRNRCVLASQIVAPHPSLWEDWVKPPSYRAIRRKI